MGALVILFAKAPIAGQVKTRLIPYLTAETAARLHEALTADIWERLHEVPGVELELHTDVETDAWPGMGPRRLQAAGDLGQRMLSALDQGLARGYAQVMIVGSDIPELPVDAIGSLLASQADLALGPTSDGGFYAICCRRTHAGQFANVRWSTMHALTDTISAAAGCGLSIQIGPPWHDLDSPEDLERLPASLQAIVK